MSAGSGLVGAWRPRVEDDRLLAGRGRYVADIDLPGLVEVALVRSTVAHGHLQAVDVGPARLAPGVVDVITAEDLTDVRPPAHLTDWARPTLGLPLARDRIRYVGAPIAAVVAEDRYRAEDAAELIWPEIEPLPAVVTLDDALAPDAVLLFDDWPDNRLVHSPAPASPAVDRLFDELTTIGGTYTTRRQAAMPIETRGVVAEFDGERITVWTSTQLPHMLRTLLAEVLDRPENAIRVVAPDVGGSFGGKAQLYPEEFLIPWLAIRIGRPVRWIEDRYEHMVAACHGRDMRIELEAAVREDGTIAALRGRIEQDVGSGELFPGSYGPAFVAWGQLTGPYRIAHQQVDVTAVVTTKTPCGAYRGYGFPEAAFATERLIDKVARAHDLSPLELRLRMILGLDELPYVTAAGARLDSGSHRVALERCAALGRAARDRVESREGHVLGLGLATYVEATGGSYHGTTGRWAAHDACELRFESDGGLTVAVGTTTTGQGVKTMVATLAAEELGVPIERVRVVMGDTDATPHGLGGHSSRSTVVMAGAIGLAAGRLRDKGQAIAAHLLGVPCENLELRHDGFGVSGSDTTSAGWREIAGCALGRTFALPTGIQPGLSAGASYEPDTDSLADERGRLNQGAAYTNAAHAAVVSVELATGVVRVVDYVVVHDCGRVVNPLVVRGQIQGGVAQGIAGALFEELPYDSLGQPLATNFMTYLVPTAYELPSMTLEEIESPSPVTARGVKGVGETGVIGSAPAIAAAVEDALAEFEMEEITSTPIRPAELLRAIHRAPQALMTEGRP